jgi:hypothetical protein
MHTTNPEFPQDRLPSMQPEPLDEAQKREIIEK